MNTETKSLFPSKCQCGFSQSYCKLCKEDGSCVSPQPIAESVSVARDPDGYLLPVKHDDGSIGSDRKFQDLLSQMCYFDRAGARGREHNVRMELYVYIDNYLAKRLQQSIGSEEGQVIIGTIDHVELPKDNCELCRGVRGGLPGNENVVNGVALCDYCTHIAQRLAKPLVPTEIKEGFFEGCKLVVDLSLPPNIVMMDDGVIIHLNMKTGVINCYTRDERVKK